MTNESGAYQFLWHDDNAADELIRVLDKDRPAFQGQASLHFHERTFAYSKLTIPLALLAAYLILWQPRKRA